LKTLHLRPKAVEDLDGIWLYIARDNPAAADSFIDQLTERFDALCQNPLLGPACPELTQDLRRFPVFNYVIFYSVEDDALIIERVLHGARDTEGLFG
jgi:toxin ParE1/3/4